MKALCAVLLALAPLLPASAQPAPEAVARMAADFLALRPLHGVDPALSQADAYAFQDALVRALAPSLGPVAGYKTGGHDAGPGFAHFPPGGIRGTLLAGTLRPDGAAVRIQDTRAGFLEADFAVRVGSHAINHAETDLEILAGLDAVVPFAEVPDPWYLAAERSAAGTIAANMSTRLSFVGEPVLIEGTQAWLDRINRLRFAVLNEQGAVVQAGTLDGWYAPIAAVRWLRDQLRTSGKQLEPGQLLSLGNIGIIRQLHEGSPRGPAYPHDLFRLEYYGLKPDGPATVTIVIDRDAE